MSSSDFLFMGVGIIGKFDLDCDIIACAARPFLNFEMLSIWKFWYIWSNWGMTILNISTSLFANSHFFAVITITALYIFDWFVGTKKMDYAYSFSVFSVHSFIFGWLSEVFFCFKRIGRASVPKSGIIIIFMRDWYSIMCRGLVVICHCWWIVEISDMPNKWCINARWQYIVDCLFDAEPSTMRDNPVVSTI